MGSISSSRKDSLGIIIRQFLYCRTEAKDLMTQWQEEGEKDEEEIEDEHHDEQSNVDE